MKTCREDEGLYALVPDDRELFRPKRVLSAPPKIDYRAANTPTVGAKELFEDKPIDLYLPLALLACGVIVQIVARLLFSANPTSLSQSLTRLGMVLIVSPAVMMIGVLIAAKFRQIDFGHLGVAALKLAAICIAPTSAAILLLPIARIIPIFGALLLFAVEFVVYFALIGTMFKLDESDTWYCVCVFFVLDVAMYFAIRAAGMGM